MMLVNPVWGNSPLSRMSTGAKHLHGDRPAYLSACKRLTRFPSVCIKSTKDLKVAQVPSVLQLRLSVSGRPVNKLHTLAIASRLNCRGYWRGVAEPERWAGRVDIARTFCTEG